jgi:Na+-transporting methylmalonyl-CoA/oxaloacetate decarboxylase gamma subunit
MKDALFITWVGMGLVFIGLLALWGMMAFVVKLTNGRKKVSVPGKTHEDQEDAGSDPDCIRMAAAAAVSAALVLMNTTFSASPHREKEEMSPWQAAHRSLQISAELILPRRKD